jgi:hypothetical protein
VRFSEWLKVYSVGDFKRLAICIFKQRVGVVYDG